MKLSDLKIRFHDLPCDERLKFIRGVRFRRLAYRKPIKNKAGFDTIKNRIKKNWPILYQYERDLINLILQQESEQRRKEIEKLI
jgi:hypothetical protein